MKINLSLFQFGPGTYYQDSVFLPVTIGMIWSYAKTFPIIKDNFTDPILFFIRETPEKILKEFDRPGVFAFSCYIWNWEISCLVARAIKKKFPQSIVIFGGPQVPNDSDEFFCKFPFVDICVHGEGEITFKDILLRIIKLNKKYRFFQGVNNWSDIKKIATLYNDILGISINDGSLSGIKTVPRSRILDLDILPSPFLTGTFKNILEAASGSRRWMVTWETNRGCPYKCSFCDWGSAIATKVRKFSEERLLKEIVFFGENKIDFINGADANFGIFERDYRLAEGLGKTKEEYGFPNQFRINYAKNSSEKVFDIACLLKKYGLDQSIKLSVQSMDPHTLNSIKRKNLKIDSLSRFVKQYNKKGIRTFTEVILGLPGETLNSFKLGVDTLIRGGFHNSIRIHRCLSLPNSEINEKDYVKTHGLIKRKLPVTITHLSNSKQKQIIQEFEELVVSTKTMPLADWKEAYLFGWAVLTFHVLNLTQAIAIIACEEGGVSYETFYTKFIEFGRMNPNSLLGQEILKTRERINVALEGKGWDVEVENMSDILWAPDEASFLRLSPSIDNFYNEIGNFLKYLDFDVNGYDKNHFYSDLIRYQRSVAMRTEIRNDSVCLNYNFHGFCQNVLEGRRMEIKKSLYRLDIKDTRSLKGEFKNMGAEVFTIHKPLKIMEECL